MSASSASPSPRHVVRSVARRARPLLQVVRPLLPARARRAAGRVARRALGAPGPRPPRTGSARIRFAAWDVLELRRKPGEPWEQLPLADGTSAAWLNCYSLVLHVPDVGSLVRLASAGVVQGRARRVQARIASFPREHRVGLRLPRPGKSTTSVHWSLDEEDDDDDGGGGARLSVQHASKRPLPALVHEVCRGAVRAHHWDSAGGVLFGLERSADLDGVSAWPAGLIRDKPVPASTTDEPQSLTAPRAAGLAVHRTPAVMTVVANPTGRSLVGSPQRYRAVTTPGRLELHDAELHEPELHGPVPHDGPVLVLEDSRPVEAALCESTWARYAVTELAAPPADGFGEHALRCLAATGMVFVVADRAQREQVVGLGVVAVEVADRSDLAWYRLSVDAWRTATVRHDPLLRHTSLAPGGGPVALPTVSVLVPSRRPDDLLHVLPDLAGQSYPAAEIVVGTHGYRLEDSEMARLGELGGPPLRVVEVPADLTLGESLGRLSRVADGELLAKVDDDDQYGHHHLTDLVVTLHTTGADCVAKGARFVWMPDLDLTIDRAWTAPELHDVYVAGGTMLLPRRSLLEAGGWSTSPKHVDTHLAERLRQGGGTVRRLHGLDYVYVRRMSGHTWTANVADMLAQGETRYAGLPAEVIERAPGTVRAEPGPAARQDDSTSQV